MYVPKKKRWRFSSQHFWYQGVFVFWGRFVGLEPIFVERVNNLKFQKWEGHVLLEK